VLSTVPEASGPAFIHFNQEACKLASKALAAAASAKVWPTVIVEPPM